MNQAFRRNFDEAENDTAKPVQAYKTVEPGENYIEEGHTRNICFVWLDGKRMFLNYSYLVSGEFSPQESIINLYFTSHAFIIKGVKLQNLFYDIMHQITRQVTCTDKRYNDVHEDDKSVVNEIILMPPTQE